MKKKMEGWFTRYCPTNAAEICTGANAAVFELWCARISEATIDMSPRQAYGELRALMAALWSGLRTDDGHTGAQVRVLAQLWWDLEHPLPERGEERFEPMEPELSTEESMRRLELLDRGKAHFKRLLIAAFTGPLQHIGVRNLVMRWARIQYECVHGFQAPPTTDPQRAVRDAMGETDHYAEMMRDILTQVDGKEPE